jgi:AcrR family transcriptional regulator
MTTNLQFRKRQLVRDAIYDAAIELFTKKGFDETTVDEIADASGISRRSFFRYFESKDDLLALNIVNNGEFICQTVALCSPTLSLLEVVRRAVTAGVSFTENQPRTRQIIELAVRSLSARQAQFSRLTEQEEKLAIAFAARMKGSSYHLKPYLMSVLTWSIISSATLSWFQGEFKDIQTAARNAFLILSRVFQEDAPNTVTAVDRLNGGRSFSKPRKLLTKPKR